MTAQTYASIKQTVAIALTQQAGVDLTTYGATFEAQFPQAISYAETRIYQEIPMVAARTRDASLVTVAGDRRVSMAGLAQPFVVPEELYLITPALQTNPSLGTRVRFDLVSVDFINFVWPNTPTTVTPSLSYQGGRYWALETNATILLAPTPDAVYTVDIIGLVQNTPLSADNTTTYLSTFYPALLEAGCLVFLAGALTRNFGAQSDEPQQAQSWESQFMKLLAAARYEEARRRGLAADMPVQQKAAA
jgi:hypothetical protein